MQQTGQYYFSYCTCCLAFSPVLRASHPFTLSSSENKLQPRFHPHSTAEKAQAPRGEGICLRLASRCWNLDAGWEGKNDSTHCFPQTNTSDLCCDLLRIKQRLLEPLGNLEHMRQRPGQAWPTLATGRLLGVAWLRDPQQFSPEPRTEWACWKKKSQTEIASSGQTSKSKSFSTGLQRASPRATERGSQAS